MVRGQSAETAIRVFSYNVTNPDKTKDKTSHKSLLTVTLVLVLWLGPKTSTFLLPFARVASEIDVLDSVTCISIFIQSTKKTFHYQQLS